MTTTGVDRIAGLSGSVAIKAPCQYRTTANITLSGLAVQAGGTWGSTLTQDDSNPTRILVMNQTNPVDNGVWNPGSGTWQRARDFNGSRDVVQGTLVHVLQDATALFYELTTADPVIGTSSLAFAVVDAAALSAVLGDLIDTANVSKNDALLGVKWVGPNSLAPSLATTQHQMNEDAYTAMSVIDDDYKAAIRALTSTVNLASVLEPFAQYCYDRAREVVWPAGQYTFEPIAINVNGGRLDLGMKWTGAGKNVTILKRSGASTDPLITIQQTTPASTSTSIQLMMRDMSLLGSGLTGTGLKLDGCAAGWIENCTFDGWDYGADLQSTLIFWFSKNTISANNTGVRVQRRSTDSFCNLLGFRDNQINSNQRFGLDLDATDSMNICGNQFEANGVAQSTSTVTVTAATPAVVSWASHGLSAGDPVIFTNSGGALPTGITADYIYYVSATDLAAGTFKFSATVGGSLVATSDTGTGTHTASSPKTGAIVVRKACVDELGAVVLNITNGNRFEGNRGADIRTEYMTTAFGLYVNIDGNLMAGTSDGPMIAIGYARKVTVKSTVAPVGTSTWNINTDQLTLENAKVINLLRPGGTATFTTVLNSGYGGVDYEFGETGSYTATLTGVDAVVTGTITYTVQGRRVDLNIPNITGTSNTTACSLTGMPAAIRPRSTSRSQIGIVRNNGGDIISQYDVTTSGTINLANGTSGTFTASGTKGTQRSSICYQM